MNSKANAEAARLIRADAGLIADRWEARIREALPAAAGLPELLLRNYLPTLLDELAGGLERGGKHPQDERSPSVHGTERAAIEGFDLVQLMAEYAILKAVLLEYLDSRVRLDQGARDLMHSLLDNQCRAAAAGFSRAVLGAQEAFVRGLAHDLQSPLSAVSMNLDMIARRKDRPDQLEPLIERARRGVEKVNRLVDAMLDAARIRAGGAMRLDFEVLALEDVLANMVEDARLTYGDRIQLRLPRESVRGRFSEAAIVRSVQNLLDNALKYGAADAPVVVALEADAAEARISVHNLGAPIPAPEQAEIFKPFRQSRHATGRGWGIGLAVVESLVRAHGGRVGVESSAEAGTRFWIALPRRGAAGEDGYAVLPKDA